MSVIYTPRKPQLDLRLAIFPAVMLVLLTLLFFRLWYFQVVKAPELAERADVSREDKVIRPAPRGLIYDRNGELLAGLKPQVVITGVTSILDKNPGVVDKLAEMLGIDAKRLKPKIDAARHSPGLPMPIFVGADPEVGTRIAENEGELPGIGVELEPTRTYPDSTSYTHVIGYVRLPNKEDQARIRRMGREPADFVGKGGIERAYEAQLMGQPGDEVMQIDAKRRPLRVLRRDNPVPGDSLVLTIDGSLQRLASQLMAEHKYVGGVVALDPKTGEVLCMVSSPTYDLSMFQQGITKEQLAALYDDPNKPLIKRAMQSSYSPGSTFKIVTSLAAYETGKFDTTHTVFCDGGYRIGKAWIKCLGHHGAIGYKQAIEKSCNTYFADLGSRVGEQALCKASLEAGLGESTGIDIGGESLGVVPTTEWLKKHYSNRHWYGGDTVNFSIGQGWVRATPLQMADVAAMVANNGTIYRPHLVREIKSSMADPNPTRIQPEVLHQVNADPQFWATVRDALDGVIEEGTGRGTATIPNLIWAGKTGSTEHGTRGEGLKTHSWFVGYAPEQDPKIAVCVLVEDGGHGADAAAPIAKEVVQHYLFPPRAPANNRPSASISAASLRSPRP
ncbi:MAG TPA: penicillin-binding protein 2 [Fimbriimonas sp.]|nr:penicillin-binding protein 2 [Fimbriimonas sp.]